MVVPDQAGGENLQRMSVRNTEWPRKVDTDRSHGCLRGGERCQWELWMGAEAKSGVRSLPVDVGMAGVAHASVVPHVLLHGRLGGVAVDHSPQVPELHGLVLAVGQQISPIACVLSLLPS